MGLFSYPSSVFQGDDVSAQIISSQQPIGVFDSGVGGLSVLREIHQLLPNEQLHYVADSGFAPYGNRSTEYILARCECIVRFFLDQKVKAIVIACNTATAVAVDQLRSWCPVPIIAMEPAIKPASLHTKSGKIGVLATEQTVISDKVGKLIAAHGQAIEIFLSSCVGFVELVEQGKLVGSETEDLVRSYVLPLINQGVDTLVLGCTHYPFLESVIQQVAGEHIQLIDPSPAIAQQLKRRLHHHQILASEDRLGQLVFWSSGDPVMAVQMITRLLSDQTAQVDVLPLPASQF